MLQSLLYVLQQSSFAFPGGNDLKCKRDLGIIIEGIVQDLLSGGNEYSIATVIEYFDGNSLLQMVLVN